MKTILRSRELSCPSCVAKIEKALTSKQGVSSAKVFFNSGRIEVEHDSDKIKADELVKTVQAAGYQAAVTPF
jgi:copper chaperone